MVTYDEGLAVAKRLGMRFCETSALTQEGLKVCFDEAVSRDNLSCNNIARNDITKNVLSNYISNQDIISQ